MTQAQQILAHLKSGRPITPLEALSKFQCLRLGARIYDLRQDGHPIAMELVPSRGKWFARYYLPKTTTKRAA